LVVSLGDDDDVEVSADVPPPATWEDDDDNAEVCGWVNWQAGLTCVNMG